YKNRHNAIKNNANRHTNDNYKSTKNHLKSMGVVPASIEEICGIISEINQTSAVGIDGFLMRHFKLSKFNSSILISKLINKILETEIWPTELKIQILRPVYKKGVLNDMTNYRPISLLPAINKIIEKFFASKLT